MLCTGCGLENPEGTKCCIRCGREFVDAGQKAARCSSCGRENETGASFCSGCGRPFNARAEKGKNSGATGGDPYAKDFTSNIIKDIIFTLITCGIYGLFWQARQMRAVNYLLHEEWYSFLKWFLLTMITCGIYHIYFEYIMAKSINEIQRTQGMPVSTDLPLLSVILSIFGGSIAADAIQQYEINRLFGRQANA